MPESQSSRAQTFESHSDEETIAWGRRFAATLPAKAVVLLIGNLGAGKTTLAKGILSGLGVTTPDEVSSPTFTLIHEYSGNSSGEARRAYHIDLYRLDTEAEVGTLGLDELFDRQAVVLIEWGERFPRLLPPHRIEIGLTPGDSPGNSDSALNEDSRTIEVREL
jgi:tRNA threonylcarbamoyladenosine biosynthesis protein TsaE